MIRLAVRSVAALVLCGAASANVPARQLLGAPLDWREPISMFVADGDRRSGFRASDRELARWACRAWQRTAGDGLRPGNRAEADALVRLYRLSASDERASRALYRSINRSPRP